MKQVPIYNSKCSILNIDQYSVKAMKVKATELQHLGYTFLLYKALFFDADVFICLFDLILYVHSTIFQLCGTVLPGFNQY